MNTIPKPGQIVHWKGKMFVVISCDLGGTCKIKQWTSTGRITRKFLVDISELD